MRATRPALVAIVLLAGCVATATAEPALERYEAGPAQASSFAFVDLTSDGAEPTAGAPAAAAWESLLLVGQTAGVAARQPFQFTAFAAGQRNCLVIPFGVQSTDPSSTRRVEVDLGTLPACWRGELSVYVNDVELCSGLQPPATGEPLVVDVSAEVRDGRNVLMLVAEARRGDFITLEHVSFRGMDSSTTVNVYRALAQKIEGPVVTVDGREFWAVPHATSDGLRFYELTQKEFEGKDEGELILLSEER